MPDNNSNADRLAEYKICEKRGHAGVPYVWYRNVWDGEYFQGNWLRCRHCGTEYFMLDVPTCFEDPDSRPEGVEPLGKDAR